MHHHHLPPSLAIYDAGNFGYAHLKNRGSCKWVTGATVAVSPYIKMLMLNDLASLNPISCFRYSYSTLACSDKISSVPRSEIYFLVQQKSVFSVCIVI
jgi:hypothetical protein